MKLKECTLCGLCKTRKNVALGVGKKDANIMFVGEAPGRDEDAAGRAFVGKAGKHLDNVLEKLKLERSQIYITNIVKCNPRENGRNRKPNEIEIDKCKVWFGKEIEIVKPKLIVLLGSVALNAKLGLSNMKLNVNTFIENDEMVYFVMYHPAVLIYDYEQYKNKFHISIKILRKYIDEKRLL